MQRKVGLGESSGGMLEITREEKWGVRGLEKTKEETIQVHCSKREFIVFFTSLFDDGSSLFSFCHKAKPQNPGTCF